MVWRVATLPMSHYIVQEITTRSVPQSYAGYLRPSQSLRRCYITFLWSCHFVSVVICGSCELVERKQYVVDVKSVVMWAGVRV